MSTTATKEAPSTKVITGKVRLSYAHVWKPTSMEEGGDKKYSCAILIPKSDTETVTKLKNAIEAAIKLGVDSKWGGKKPARLKLPLRDGDEEKPDDENYEGCYWINASSPTKPGIVDLMRNEITNEEDVYSGCYARVSLNFFAFDTKGNKGIAAGLNNIQKVKDGEPFGGKSNAKDDFNDDYEGDGDDDDDFMK